MNEKSLNQLKERLKESEKKYNAFYNNAPLSYQSLNEEGEFLDINPKWLSTLGYDKEEVIGRSFAEFLHPDWKPHFEKNFPEFKKRGYVNDVQFKIRHKDGHFLDISFEGCIGYHPDGSFRQTYCVFMDISRQKLLEARLIEEKDQSQQYLDIAGIMFIVINTEGIITLVNKMGCEILGYSDEEIIGKNWFETFLPEQTKKDIIPVSKKLLEGIIDPYKYIENKILTKSGKERLIAWHNSILKDSDGRIIAHISAGNDITEKKQLEELLYLKNLVFESSIAANSISDSKGIIIDANRAFIDLWSYESKEEVIGRSISDFFQQKEEAENIIIKLEQNNKWQGEFSGKKKDGSSFTAQSTATLIRDDEKKIIGYQSSVIDVTEFNKVYKELKNSEEKFKTLVTNNEEIVYMIDKDGIFRLSEGRGLYKLGLKPGEVVGQSAFDIYKNYPDMLDKMKEAFRGERVILEVKVGKDFFRSWYTPHKNYKGEIIGLLGLSVNITEQKHTEQALEESHKNLEQIVLQRTGELEKKNEELDESLKVFVGRELKIRALEKKLKARELEK